MRIVLAAAIAAALLSAVPATADEFPIYALPGPDSYPPLEALPARSVEAEVIARGGTGLSLAGFYNDPAVLVRHPHEAPQPRGFFDGWFGH